jgi:hypothetical protein
MADYTRINPATIANLAAVIDDPTDTEAANKLAQVDLQTRRFIYDFLITKFDETTGKLLAASLDSDSLSGTVSGSTSNGGTQRGIVQGTISDVDIRSSAVTTNKIADDAVTNAKINASAVGTTEIADLAVTTGKINDLAVTEGKLINDAVTADKLKDDATGAAGAVTSDHIRSSAVTTAKIADNAVTGAKLPAGSAEGQVLVTGTTPFTFAVKTMSGGATIDANGVVTLATASQCELIERANNATNCNASAAATWQNRGSSTVAVAWVENWRIPTSAFVAVDADGKVTFTATGTYLIRASAPGYKCGKHISRLVRYNVSNVVQETYYGSSEVSAAADGVQTRTQVVGKITVAALTDYVLLEHWTEAVEAADGLGKATSSGGTYETYARMEISKIA